MVRREHLIYEKIYIYTYNFQQFFPVKTTLMIQKKINVT